MTVFETNANPLLKRLRPYTPGPTASEIVAKYGVAPDQIVKLSSNEAPLGPSPRVREAVRKLADSDELHRYPSSSVPALRSAIAELLHVTAQQVLPAAGSSQTWPMIVRAFSRPDDAVLWIDPSMTSYGEVAVLTERDEQRVVDEYPFSIGPASVSRAADEANARVVFLSSPNNTTSRLTTPAEIRRVADALPNAVVVVDEHYIEAARDFQSVSAVNLVNDVPNVIVTRSFSKMYALAGLRVGYLVASEEAVEKLQYFRPNWSISVVAEAAAFAALRDQPHLSRNIEETRKGREFLLDALQSFADVSVLPDPQGGFLLFRPLSREAEDVTESLFRRGIMIRGDLLHDWIRVSVGTEPQNQRFVEALEAALKDRPA